MKMFRIHTEYTPEHQSNAERIVGSFFDSFNIVRGTGYWKGVREDSMTVEIIASGSVVDEASVRLVAHSIKEVNNQEAVYLTITTLDTAQLL